MTEHSPEARIIPDQETYPRNSLWRRLGQRAIRVLFPYQLTEYTPASTTENSAPASDVESDLTIVSVEDEAFKLVQQNTIESDVESSDSIVIALSSDEKKFHFLNGENEQILESVQPQLNAKRLFGLFSKMYLSAGEGEVSSSENALQTGYKHTTVIDVAEKLGKILPSEVFDYRYSRPGDLSLRFGNLAVAASLVSESDLKESETMLQLQQRQNELVEEIDRDKTDLAFYDHAIIHNGPEKAYYMALHSPESILAARTLEAIALKGDGRANSTEIAEIAWSRMTVAERELFATNDDAALVPSGFKCIEGSTLSVLRSLTNKLMLTLEPRSDDFTIMTKRLEIVYDEDPLTKKTLEANPNLKPVLPTHERDILKLSKAERDMQVEAAKLYVSQTKHKVGLGDEEAIAMLDFIMSPLGRWSINQISGTPDGYHKSATALRVMHKYLRRTLRSGYSSAYRNRQVRGNKLARSSGTARQISGRIPGSSRWGLGMSMNEILDHTNSDIRFLNK